MGPETLAIVATAVAGVGTAVQTVGALQQGAAASASAKYNAQVATNNAQIAQQNATWVRQEGEAKAAQEQQKTRAKVGGIIAQQAASGVEINSGSPVEVRSSAAQLGELNAISIRADATRRAYGYETEASGFEGQSQLDRAEAKNNTTASYIGAGSSLLGGLGKAGMEYADYQRNNSLSSE